MAKSNKKNGPQARLPKGFLDTSAEDIRSVHRMLETIRQVYERYGFEPLETPAIEYTDALGKFLPDQDRPNEGVFSFQDEDEQWLSLRYDLTAPLARYVAENFERLPKPFRRYQVGPVWRNEKPGPGRFRQFTQFDADTVGTDNIAADAEICMLAADTLDELNLERGQYVIKVNNRKVLDGLMEVIGLGGDENLGRRLGVLRAIDKLDRLGIDGVRELLGDGRRDESGDFTKGAGLQPDRIELLIGFVAPEQYLMETEITRVNFKSALMPSWQPVASGRSISDDRADYFAPDKDHDFEGGKYYLDTSVQLGLWSNTLTNSRIGLEGIEELSKISSLVRSAEYGSKRFAISSSVVRGLEYYTGPVFEAEITVPVVNEDGQTVRFGSVGGGGRYDGLVERFMGTKVPATGFSIGVSRLQAALAALGKSGAATAGGPVVVLVMEKDRLADYQRMAQRLRNPDDGGPPIRAEMYLGKAKRLGEQFKYADMRKAPCVIFQGENERNQDPPVVQIKDLVEGAKAAATIKDSKEWREGRPAQFSVKEDELVAKVREVLARHRG